MSKEQRTILIAQRNPQTKEHINNVLHSMSFNVDWHETMEDVLDAIQTHGDALDVCILDLDLEGEKKSMECLRKIKSCKSLQHIPVIIQTDNYNSQCFSDALANGAYYFLEQLGDENILRAVLNSAVEHKTRFLKALQKQVEILPDCAPAPYLHEARFYIKTLDDIIRILNLLCSVFPDPERVSIGIHELLTNAIEHGNLGITYDEKSKLLLDNTWKEEIDRRLALKDNAGKHVEITIYRSVEKIEMIIEDQGLGFNNEKYMDIDPLRIFDSHGRGIAMANKMAFDKLEYVGRGNKVICTVYL